MGPEPFHVFHQPVIVAIAYCAVQWQAGILAKILVIVLSSFAVTLGLTEVLRRIKPLRPLFGMKARRAGAGGGASGPHASP